MGDSEINSTRNPFRILMTADAVGGVWQYSIDLIRELSRHGVHVLLATLGPRASEEQRRQALDIPGLRLAESDFALEWMTDAWADVDTSGEWLLDLATDFAPDVIHLNGYAHAALDWRAPTLVVAHSCVLSWWRAVHGVEPGTDWDEYKLRVSAGLAAANAIVTPSAFMAAALQREYGLTSGTIRVIHNFSSASGAPRHKKESVIIACGRVWDEAKNIALLNSIAPDIDWPIYVTGPESSTFTDKKAHFLGVVSRTEMVDRMSRAAIFAHPAFYEPFGLSVLEAANARCCLVLSDIPSMRELWDGAAVFVDPRDPERWVPELNRLTRDSITREKLADRAFLHATKYPAHACVTAYRHVYSSLADSPRKSQTETAA